ncbi:hypothetical protein AUP68_09535 [Ilyonectria robusta]
MVRQSQLEDAKAILPVTAKAGMLCPVPEQDGETHHPRHALLASFAACGCTVVLNTVPIYFNHGSTDQECWGKFPVGLPSHSSHVRIVLINCNYIGVRPANPPAPVAITTCPPTILHLPYSASHLGSVNLYTLDIDIQSVPTRTVEGLVSQCGFVHYDGVSYPSSLLCPGPCHHLRPDFAHYHRCLCGWVSFQRTSAHEETMDGKISLVMKVKVWEGGMVANRSADGEGATHSVAECQNHSHVISFFNLVLKEYFMLFYLTSITRMMEWG